MLLEEGGVDATQVGKTKVTWGLCVCGGPDRTLPAPARFRSHRELGRVHGVALSLARVQRHTENREPGGPDGDALSLPASEPAS